MGKYRTLGTFFDRIFRNDLNANFNDIDADVKAQKARVDDLIVGVEQPSEVVDARGGFAVLRDRLADTDAQLDTIATQRTEGIHAFRFLFTEVKTCSPLRILTETPKDYPVIKI